MENFQYQFQSGDGLELFAQGWKPEGTCKSIVCLIHGLGEHSGRYSSMAEVFCRRGYALFSFDLRGHGKSPGKRGDTPSFETFMEDIQSFHQTVVNRFADIPIIFYGHSLGGLLMLNYLIRRQPKVVAAVSSAAGLRTSLTEQKSKMWMVETLGRITPTLPLRTGLNPQMLSHDAEVVRRYVEDPLVHDLATLRMARETNASIDYVFAHAQNIQCPLLIGHGSDDQLIYPSGSKELANLVPNSELVIFEGLYHEIHNELTKDQVFRTILDWFDGILPS